MSAPAETAAQIRSAISAETWDLPSFTRELTEARATNPFGDEAVAFCTELSSALLHPSSQGAGQAQVISLGYWLRPASIRRMSESFQRSGGPDVLLVPRGRVFHVTPANVDTMFAYSWLLALLAGNVSVVRISSRETELASRLLDTIAAILDQPAFAGLRRANRLVRTDHDDAIVAGLSAIADVRVVWGGDETVDYFRRFPLPPRGRDVTFPNRHSLALLDAAAIRSSSDEELAALADRFFNDAYWFDQAGCSSPRLIVWRATSGEDAEDARQRFHSAISEAIARRSLEIETGLAITKMVFAFRRAAAHDGLTIDTPSNEITWVELPDLTGYDRTHSGGGLFFEFVTGDLAAELAGLVGPQDQTAVCYGLDEDAVLELARGLNGRGIDRFVRVGRALEFSATWDGFDLLGEFVKRVVVDV
ncbi:MAG: hypothetical protein QOF11_2817 [Chloroflexota bacterium]|jgi:hypothetical protein|nr:hypothetical protein [Chloroflexota bacterium]